MSDDPREELASIAASVRALLSWHEATGSDGLPRGDDATRPAAASPPIVAPAAPALAPVREQPHPEQAHAEPAHAEPAHAEPAHSAAPSHPQPKQSADERRTRLAVLSEEVRSCERCGLHAHRKQTVFARGNPFAELVFIGEGPGADEDAQGEPFVGRAGQLLDKMIVAMGYGRDDVYVCNIVKCRPPENRKPEAVEMDACTPYLTEQLALIQPKAIVALGATAVQGLIGTMEGITRLRGKWKLYKGRVPIMPTFHPAYLLRQPAAKRDVWADLQEVMRVLGKSPKPAA